MKNPKVITGKNEKEIAEKLRAELKNHLDELSFSAEIKQEGNKIFLNIEVDPGGGFESGDASTSLSAELKKERMFGFAIHKENLLLDIGKLFGMQDIKIGYPAFDKKFIIKTNDKDKTKKIFSNSKVRATLSALTDFTFKIAEHKATGKTKVPFLELIIDDDIRDPRSLLKIYNAFYFVLSQIEK